MFVIANDGMDTNTSGGLSMSRGSQQRNEGTKNWDCEAPWAILPKDYNNLKPYGKALDKQHCDGMAAKKQND